LVSEGGCSHTDPSGDDAPWTVCLLGGLIVLLRRKRGMRVLPAAITLAFVAMFSSGVNAHVHRSDQETCHAHHRETLRPHDPSVTILVEHSGGVRLGEPEVIDLPYEAYAPHVSPDGTRLLLAGPELAELKLVDLDTDQTRVLAHQKGAGVAPKWRPSSEGVAIRVAKRPVSDAPLKALSVSGTFLGPYPDRRHVAVWQQEGSCYLRNGDDVTEVVPPLEDDIFFYPQLSPDARYVSFMGLKTGLYLYRVADGQVFNFGPGTHARFAPDATALVFDRTHADDLTSDLYWVELHEAPRLSPLTQTFDADESYPSVTADHRSLYFLAEGRVYRAPLIGARAP